MRVLNQQSSAHQFSSVAVVAVALLSASCVSKQFPPLTQSTFAFHADTLRTDRIADGVTHSYVYAAKGPWAIHVLDVDLTRCNSALAVKGAPGAVGREKTSVLMQQLAASKQVVGGVNADFFLFTPPGVPTGALVVDGHVITPPSKNPVFAIDSAGVARIATLTMTGETAGKPGDPVAPTASLTPFHPRDAVSGHPMLVRDSAISPGVDTEGGASFAPVRHPRTAVGIARNGTRVLLVTVDGRQKPYSDGMNLRELATVMLALGAREALNLDGGGSTTMVSANQARALRIVNVPSDSAGERPVGDALAIVHGCKAR